MPFKGLVADDFRPPELYHEQAEIGGTPWAFLWVLMGAYCGSMGFEPCGFRAWGFRVA